jgi:hypothetical protein
MTKNNSPNTTRWGFFAILGAAALLYLALLPQLYVGYFNDDALYTVGAKSLLQGRYVRLYHPLLQPLNHPLPGFPAFLALFLWIVEPRWDLLKLVNIALTVLSGLLLSNLLRTWFKLWICVLSVALYAFNPLTATYAATVMPEPCFLFFILAALLLFKRQLTHPAPAEAWILSLLLGWGTLIRPEGIVLSAAIAFGAVLTRNRPLLGRVLFCSISFLGSVLLRNYLLTHSFTNYLETFGETSGHILSAFSRILLQTAHLLHTLFVENVLGFTGEASSFPELVLHITLVMGAVSLTILGYKKWMIGSLEGKRLAQVIGFFCILYLLIHVFWPIDARYFLPVFPFVTAMMLGGLTDQRLQKILRKEGIILLGGILVCSSLGQTMYRIHQTWTSSTPAVYRLPKETFAWIRSHTAPDDIFLGKAPVIYLYTGRQAVSAVRAETDDQFYVRLKAMGIGYALSQARKVLPTSGNRQDPERVWEESQRWLASRPDAFQEVYRNPKEETVIFKIIAKTEP